jgi:protein-L-isoaspartate(D-aspartate) O-methyltransferase
LNHDTLIQQLIHSGALDSPALIAAFQAIPRDRFLPGFPPEVVFSDSAIFTLTDVDGEYIGGCDQPSQLATRLKLAQLTSGQNVLEIGAGVGYSAAITQKMIGEGHITSLEINPQAAETARNHLQSMTMGSDVNIVGIDAAGGYSVRASYDRIISGVAVWDIPAAWVRQLRPNGRIVTPIYLDGLQVCAAFAVQPDGSLYADEVVTCANVPIQGTLAPPPQFVHVGGGSALRIYANFANQIDSVMLHLMFGMDNERCHLGTAPSVDEYWNGFVPYLMLHEPDGYRFVCYSVGGDRKVYGLVGKGFGLISRGSATFVAPGDLGDTHCYGSADAFVELADRFTQWDAAGRPTIHQMRLRLIPKGSAPTTTLGRIFDRQDHHLEAWLEV